MEGTPPVSAGASLQRTYGDGNVNLKGLLDLRYLDILAQIL